MTGVSSHDIINYMSDNDDKPVKKLSDLPPKQLAYHLLKENGLSTEEAAKSLDYKQNTAYHLNSKLKKYMFTGNFKAQKTAHTTITALSAGQAPKGSYIEKVNDSTALKAAMYISDHNDPIVQHVETKSTSMVAIITPESMDKYK